MLTAIGDVMRRCYERGWITTRDGNISMKKRDGRFLYITPSGWRKTIVHPEHVVRLEIIIDPATGLRVPKVNELQKPCQPNLEMSASSQSRNVRFMFRRLPEVPLVPAATASATDGFVWG
jgi:hypothetical protein